MKSQQIQFKSKIRDGGSSLVTSVPIAFVQLLEIEKGDFINWEWNTDNPNELRVTIQHKTSK